MKPVFHINFDFDTDSLLEEANKQLKDKSTASHRGYEVMYDDWLFAPGGEVANEECKRFLNHYDLEEGDGRYHLLKADSYLIPHVDIDSTCGVNHVLSTDRAPVNYMKEEYTYKTALLDTTQKHGVVNLGYPDRIIYKICFRKHTYEEVIQKINGTH